MIRVGQRLAEARFRKGLTLDDVSQATKIKKEFLAAIEEGEYEKLPSFAYSQGFVRNYAKLVSLSEKETLALFRREFDTDKTVKVLPEGFSKNYSRSRFKNKQQLMLIGIIFLIVFTFIAYQFRFIFLNPPLNIISPKNAAVITGSRVVVLGKTDPEAVVVVNNNPVAVDQSGIFKKNLNLFPGNNQIVVSSTNKFGRQSTSSIKVEVKESK
jgi:cytoskeletal protein RodZ